MNRTESPQLTAFEKVLLGEICKIAQKSYQNGWNPGTSGNFSLRRTAFSERVVWMSPSGLCKGELKPEQFLAVDMETSRCLQECNWVRPSAETALHVGIYKGQPKARSILHFHPIHIVKRSMEEKKLVFSQHEMQKIFGYATHEVEVEVPMIENTQDMLSLGKNAGNLLHPTIPALVLKGHGVYAWGAHPQAALNVVEALEFMCAIES